MTRGDVDYYAKLAEQEEAMAAQAYHPVVRETHTILAAAYRERVVSGQQMTASAEWVSNLSA